MLGGVGAAVSDGRGYPIYPPIAQRNKNPLTWDSNNEI